MQFENKSIWFNTLFSFFIIIHFFSNCSYSYDLHYFRLVWFNQILVGLKKLFKNPGSRMLMSSPLGRLRKTQCFIKVKIYFIWWTLYKLRFGLKDQVRILVVPNEPTRITNICPEWACEYKMFENLVLIFLQLKLSSVGPQLTFSTQKLLNRDKTKTYDWLTRISPSPF